MQTLSGEKTGGKFRHIGRTSVPYLEKERKRDPRKDFIQGIF